MPSPKIDILMYHSISDAGGPTSISPAVFADQMAALAESDVDVITLDDLVAAREGGFDLPARSVIITFDDGFTDFAETAWPVLDHHGFSSTVYLPTAHVGRQEDWEGAHTPGRRLMGWEEIKRLSEKGVIFGSHSVSHPDLNSLSAAELTAELEQSREKIEAELGRQTAHFAPPYGLANSDVRREISNRYKTSVGTRFARASEGSPLHDLPRLEMFYFTDKTHWRNHLAGRGGAYFLRRRVLRQIGKLVLKPWQ